VSSNIVTTQVLTAQHTSLATTFNRCCQWQLLAWYRYKSACHRNKLVLLKVRYGLLQKSTTGGC